jgi:hypothetical protein
MRAKRPPKRTIEIPSRRVIEPILLSDLIDTTFGASEFEIDRILYHPKKVDPSLFGSVQIFNRDTDQGGGGRDFTWIPLCYERWDDDGDEVDE